MLQPSVTTTYPKSDRTRRMVEANAVEVVEHRSATSPSPASRLMTAITPPKSMLRSTPSRKQSSRLSATSAGTSPITDSSHAIIVPSEGCEVRLTIGKNTPLSLKGVTSYFPTRKPTREEYKRASTRFELTSEAPEWNPHTNLFSDQEEALVDDSGMLLDYAQPECERTLLPIMTYKQEISEEITPAEYDLASALEAHVSFSNVMQVSNGTTKNKKHTMKTELQEEARSYVR